jgi:hypothetical protein
MALEAVGYEGMNTLPQGRGNPSSRRAIAQVLPSTICCPIPRRQLSRRPFVSFHDTSLLAVLCHIPPSPVLANDGAVAVAHIIKVSKGPKLEAQPST